MAETQTQPNASISYSILDTVINAVKGLGIKAYPLNRPKSTMDREDMFAVVSIPTPIRRPVHGNDDYRYVTTGIIYAFCRAHTDGTPTIDRQTRLVRQITELFPINGEHVKGINPEVLHRGLDEYNFQVSAITFDIRSEI